MNAKPKYYLDLSDEGIWLIMSTNDKCDFVEEIGNQMKVNNIKFEESSILDEASICKTPLGNYIIISTANSWVCHNLSDSAQHFNSLHDAKTFVIQDLIRRYNELHSFLYEQKEVKS